MKQYIDKSIIMKEIEERLNRYETEYEELARYEVWITANKIAPKIRELKDFRSFIDNIEIKDGAYDEALKRAKAVLEIAADKAIAWLEKQGDANKEYWRGYREGKQEVLDKYAELKKQGEQEEPQVYKTEDGEVITYSESEGYKVIEPKFKVGDWITNGDYTWKIVDVKPLDYILQSQDGDVVDDTISYVDKEFHSFTIDDVKEGDILAGKIDGYSYILIYKQTKDEWIETYGHYYNIVDRFCVPSQLFCRNYQGIFIPATKEQCDILFAKIKESGYEWDTKKKELKKIEQKFKVGDWITNSNETVQITGYDIDYGHQVDYKGNLLHRDSDIIEKEYHLWTIQDAKDGDVLVYGDNPADHHLRIIMLFKSMRTFNSAFNHFHIFDDEFRINDWCDCGRNAHPATKEQRDLLFQKMKEAGYEWDAEKKELKLLITNGGDYCQENCKGFQETGKCFADGDCEAKINAEKKELKKCVIDEGKAEMDYCFTKMMNDEKVSSTWSEEDDRMLDDCINALGESPFRTYEIEEWLNSLKQRIVG